MDAISRLLRMARVMATLDRRCLLGRGTRMEVAQRGGLEAQFHILLEGECQIQVGTTLLKMKPGDLVLIPSGSPHRVITPGPIPLLGTAESAGDAFVTTRTDGGGAPAIDLFCGHYTFDPGAGAVLFRSLPDPVQVSFGDSADSDGTLRMLSTLMRNEAQQEGSGTAAILSALSTVLLALVLRSSSGSTTKSALWTAASDERIAAIIEEILRNPREDWTIERLSRSAAMSRATFLRHFGRQTGMTVGTFLTKVRVMTAAELLSSSDAAVANVAWDVGYQSESAFSRAFRSEVGTTPARFRRDQQRGVQDGTSTR